MFTHFEYIPFNKLSINDEFIYDDQAFKLKEINKEKKNEIICSSLVLNNPNGEIEEIKTSFRPNEWVIKGK